MRKIIFILASLMAGSFVEAKGIENVDSLNDINVIKRDTSFIYAESTMKDVVEAMSGAHAILEIKLHDWLRIKCPKEDISSLVENSKSSWTSLYTKRGLYNRVFVYVAKDSVIPAINEAETIVLDTPAAEPANVLEDVMTPELTKDEGNMARITSFTEIEPYIKNLKEEGKLKAYGKYASLPEDDACYMFVYDRDGIVVAVLRQSEDGRHYNLRAMSDDNVRNYKNCGAIWLQLK